MQFGREHEEMGRGEAWQSGSQRYGSGGYGSQGYGSSQQWSQGSQGSGSQEGSQTGRGFSGESQGYGSPGYGRESYGQSYGSRERYDSQGYGSQGYGYPGGGYPGAAQSREPGRSGQEFGGGTSPYGPGSQGFRGTPAFSQTPGYSEGGYSEGPSGTTGRTRGRYTGRGPKGYTRSDDRIKEDVNDRLEQHGEIDAWEIVVMVQNGEVTLDGTVPDRRTKRLSEDVAEESPGVKQVHNRLRIQGNIESGRRELTSGQSGQSSTGTSGSSTSSTEGSSRSGSTSKSSTRT